MVLEGQDRNTLNTKMWTGLAGNIYYGKQNKVMIQDQAQAFICPYYLTVSTYPVHFYSKQQSSRGCREVFWEEAWTIYCSLQTGWDKAIVLQRKKNLTIWILNAWYHILGALAAMELSLVHFVYQYPCSDCLSTATNFCLIN